MQPFIITAIVIAVKDSITFIVATSFAKTLAVTVIQVVTVGVLLQWFLVYSSYQAFRIVRSSWLLQASVQKYLLPLEYFAIEAKLE
jgi:ABC-type arginine/histidine transport system permease subunit